MRKAILVCLLLCLAACAVSASAGARVSFSQAAVLPGGSYIDGQGYLIGPHGGVLTQAGEFWLETEVRKDGVLYLYAYDAEGESVPVSEVQLESIALQTRQGTVVVALAASGNYSLVGYYDPIFYDPFWGGGYPFFAILYPSTVVIRERSAHVIHVPPPRGYRSGGRHTAPAGKTHVTVPARPTPQKYRGKGSIP
jgi:hypothetical protein